MGTPPADANTTDAGIGQWIRSHVRLVVGAGIIAVVGLVFVLVWFQPQKLFLDDTVDEAFPVAQTTTAAPTTVAPTSTSPAATADGATTAAPSTTLAPTITTTSTTTTTAGPVLLTDGSFIDIGHPGSGIAQVYVLPDGSRVLRFEELDVSNGPDLRVILSASPLVEDRNAYDEEFFDIEELKGNLGNQNYDIPAEVDLADYSTVAIWCRRFNYTFNAAPLTRVAGT